jgi:hypothetical protein
MNRRDGGSRGLLFGGGGALGVGTGRCNGMLFVLGLLKADLDLRLGFVVELNVHFELWLIVRQPLRCRRGDDAATAIGKGRACESIPGSLCACVGRQDPTSVLVVVVNVVVSLVVLALRMPRLACDSIEACAVS